MRTRPAPTSAPPCGLPQDRKRRGVVLRARERSEARDEQCDIFERRLFASSRLVDGAPWRGSQRRSADRPNKLWAIYEQAATPKRPKETRPRAGRRPNAWTLPRFPATLTLRLKLPVA